MSIDRTTLTNILEALPFQAGRWVVAGSAPMLMAGLIDSIHDVDIVVDGTAWQQAVSLSDGEPRDGLLGDQRVSIELEGATVEIFNGWLGIDAAQMITEAVDLDGFRFSPLERVLESKRRLLRSRDVVHIAIIEAHLSDRQEPRAESQ